MNLTKLYWCYVDKKIRYTNRKIKELIQEMDGNGCYIFIHLEEIELKENLF